MLLAVCGSASLDCCCFYAEKVYLRVFCGGVGEWGFWMYDLGIGAIAAFFRIRV